MFLLEPEGVTRPAHLPIPTFLWYPSTGQMVQLSRPRISPLHRLQRLRLLRHLLTPLTRCVLSRRVDFFHLDSYCFLRQPPADAVPAFREFVNTEKQRLTQKKQALFKSEMDKRMADLVKFSQSFKVGVHREYTSVSANVLCLLAE